MKLKLSSSDSFTLTEVVISMFLLVIVWLAAVDAAIVGRYSASYAKHKAQAIYAAQMAIEQLRKVPYPPPSTGLTNIRIDTKATPDDLTDDFSGQQRITVSDVPGSGGYYKQAIVEVQWPEMFFGSNKVMHEYCGTYIANEPQVN